MTNDSQADLAPRAVRPKDAQRLLGIKKTALFALLRDGQLASVRIGGARLIPLAAIERLLRGQSDA